MTYEPRRVSRPFIGRWLVVSFELLRRCPARFGALIGLLTLVDDVGVQLARAYSFERRVIDTFGILDLAFVWTLVTAVARGADDRNQTRGAMHQMIQRKSLTGALGVGIVLASFSWMIYSVIYHLGAFLGWEPPRPLLDHPGQLLAS